MKIWTSAKQCYNRGVGIHLAILQNISLMSKKSGKKKKTKLEATRGGDGGQVILLKQVFRSLLVTKEKYWQQRSKSAWLKVRDQNSRYFHSRATHQFRRNEIRKLVNGSWCKNEDQIADLFVDYFQQLFQSSNPDSTRIEAVLEATPQTVTAEMNQALLANFIKLEVDFALKLMTPLKALGLDGLPPIFY